MKHHLFNGRSFQRASNKNSASRSHPATRRLNLNGITDCDLVLQTFRIELKIVILSQFELSALSMFASKLVLAISIFYSLSRCFWTSFWMIASENIRIIFLICLEICDKEKIKISEIGELYV